MHRFFDIQPPSNKTSSNKDRLKTRGHSGNKKYSGLFVFIFICLTGILLFGFFSSNQVTGDTVGPSPTPNTEEATPRRNSFSESKSEAPTTKQSEIFPTPSPSPAPQSTTVKMVRITILNGAREPGVATQTKKILENNNIQVTSVGNTQNVYPRSTIYYTVVNILLAEKIQEILIDYEPKLEENNVLASDEKILVVVGRK